MPHFTICCWIFIKLLNWMISYKCLFSRDFMFKIFAWTMFRLIFLAMHRYSSIFFFLFLFCYSKFPCENSWKLILFHGFQGHRMLSFVMSSKTDASLTSCFSQMVLLVYVYNLLLFDICTKEQTTGWLPLAARWRKFSIFLLYRFILFFFIFSPENALTLNLSVYGPGYHI